MSQEYHFRNLIFFLFYGTADQIRLKFFVCAAPSVIIFNPDNKYNHNSLLLDH
jgi:hypothetical protein